MLNQNQISCVCTYLANKAGSHSNYWHILGIYLVRNILPCCPWPFEARGAQNVWLCTLSTCYIFVITNFCTSSYCHKQSQHFYFYISGSQSSYLHRQNRRSEIIQRHRCKFQKACKMELKNGALLRFLLDPHLFQLFFFSFSSITSLKQKLSSCSDSASWAGLSRWFSAASWLLICQCFHHHLWNFTCCHSTHTLRQWMVQKDHCYLFWQQCCQRHYDDKIVKTWLSSPRFRWC